MEVQEEGAASIGKQPRANVRRGSFLLHEQRTIHRVTRVVRVVCMMRVMCLMHVTHVMRMTGARTHALLAAPRHHAQAKPATWLIVWLSSLVMPHSRNGRTWTAIRTGIRMTLTRGMSDSFATRSDTFARLLAHADMPGLFP
jgi:hypothetical protein